MTKKIIPKDIFILLAIMWAVFVIDVLLVGISLNQFGIRPRRLDGLLGMIFSPFLHGGIGHIVSNSIALLGTGILVRMAVGSKRARLVMLFSVIGSGIGTWLFAQAGVVVGASGLVYGLLGFLFGYAFFHPSIKSWAIAIVSLFLFGGAVLSILSFNPYISWAAHFWGFVSGVGTAYLIKRYFSPTEPETGTKLND
ncbi:rhomboid family intramembrane serine protease [Psychrosphaera sp. B3R10]|uniref:rhomboid family intramembrane serine protease n=1 Tax=unclassified Psychrosphaera TaxID=2641570 RepID=UPI001C093372|nr:MULTISPECIES: rhomboid family intramembrane serine protease [unclassified Psychrosphaera]MBU2881120.1 rhomboid family intramembrane serine protease [Psychrosphaera sp. I2R16]MBU2990044.1 rhomboid family intramembrane serine protease [Psychrosphaera sp. B3R10]